MAPDALAPATNPITASELDSLSVPAASRTLSGRLNLEQFRDQTIAIPLKAGTETFAVGATDLSGRTRGEPGKKNTQIGEYVVGILKDGIKYINAPIEGAQLVGEIAPVGRNRTFPKLDRLVAFQQPPEELPDTAPVVQKAPYQVLPEFEGRQVVLIFQKGDEFRTHSVKVGKTLTDAEGLVRMDATESKALATDAMRKKALGLLLDDPARAAKDAVAPAAMEEGVGKSMLLRKGMVGEWKLVGLVSEELLGLKRAEPMLKLKEALPLLKEQDKPEALVIYQQTRGGKVQYEIEPIVVLQADTNFLRGDILDLGDTKAAQIKRVAQLLEVDESQVVVSRRAGGFSNGVGNGKIYRTPAGEVPFGFLPLEPPQPPPEKAPVKAPDKVPPPPKPMPDGKSA